MFTSVRFCTYQACQGVVEKYLVIVSNNYEPAVGVFGAAEPSVLQNGTSIRFSLLRRKSQERAVISPSLAEGDLCRRLCHAYHITLSQTERLRDTDGEIPIYCFLFAFYSLSIRGIESTANITNR